MREAVRSWQESEGEISPVVTRCQALAEKAKETRRHWRRLVRERRAKRFPESERLPVQLLLLAWGMLPTLGSLLGERVRTAPQAAGRAGIRPAGQAGALAHPSPGAAGRRLRCGGHRPVLFQLHVRDHSAVRRRGGGRRRLPVHGGGGGGPAGDPSRPGRWESSTPSTPPGSSTPPACCGGRMWWMRPRWRRTCSGDRPGDPGIQPVCGRGAGGCHAL